MEYQLIKSACLFRFKKFYTNEDIGSEFCDWIYNG